jgi:hypothetical protein
MREINITMKDGTKKTFKEIGRAGGSWTISLQYLGVFAVVTDEWGNQTSIPASDIAEIKTEVGRSW